MTQIWDRWVCVVSGVDGGCVLRERSGFGGDGVEECAPEVSRGRGNDLPRDPGGHAGFVFEEHGLDVHIGSGKNRCGDPIDVFQRCT
jgi:hypothetical protein